MLSIVSTPIGNLADMTKRAIQTLVEADLIACEDTRHTKVLLDRYQITTPTVSYHQHSTLQKIDWLVEQLIQGKHIALVTDAGTPGISDPGGVLVEKVHTHNRDAIEPIVMVSIPGASSLTAALSVSGFPSDTFLFLGFLPKKKGRQSLIQSLTKLDKPLGIKTVAFFESAIRVHQTLLDFETAFNRASTVDNIEVCMCRELTKQFEEIWRGSLAESIEQTKKPQKGEFVVILHQSR